MINDKVFLGYPIPFKDICHIYPPKVKDIVGNDEAIQWQALFTMSQEELEDAYRNEDKTVMTPNPFTYLLLMYYSEEDKRPLVLNGFKQLLHEPVTIIPEMEIIVIGVEEENLDPDVHLVEPRLLNAENYFDFQNLIRDAMGLNRVEPPDPDEDPRVARIKAFLMKNMATF